MAVQYITLHCNTLHYITLYYNTLHDIKLYYITFHYLLQNNFLPKIILINKIFHFDVCELTKSVLPILHYFSKYFELEDVSFGYNSRRNSINADSDSILEFVEKYKIRSIHRRR